jgi:hypothetical protein
MDTDVARPTHQSQMAAPGVGGGKKPTSRRTWIVCGVAVVVVLAVIAGAMCMHNRHKAFNENKNINASEYQAVFLTNGQVYFGKLSDLNNKYVTISDIYYLQVQQGQNGTDGKSLQNASNSTDTNAQVSLAKLGGELHGPEDKMHIASDQVLFWENLTGGGKVTQAINAYQKSK